MAKNVERTAQTRARLITAARRQFARDGYSATGTEAILAEAGVARGALYHHFRDKAELFEEVCRALAGEAAEAIRAATEGIGDPAKVLATGSLAWIDFMAQPDSRQVLVVDAPGVLGWERWNALDRDLSYGLLLAGVEAALDWDAIRFEAGASSLAVLLNGAMNAIVLEIGAGGDVEKLKQGMAEMIGRLATDANRSEGGFA